MGEREFMPYECCRVQNLPSLNPLYAKERERRRGDAKSTGTETLEAKIGVHGIRVIRTQRDQPVPDDPKDSMSTFSTAAWRASASKLCAPSTSATWPRLISFSFFSSLVGAPGTTHLQENSDQGTAQGSRRERPRIHVLSILAM